MCLALDRRPLSQVSTLNPAPTARKGGAVIWPRTWFEWVATIVVYLLVVLYRLMR